MIGDQVFGYTQPNDARELGVFAKYLQAFKSDDGSFRFVIRDAKGAVNDIDVPASEVQALADVLIQAAP